MADEPATSSPITSRLDPDQRPWISIFGKKGSGKSVLARMLWHSWPFDGLCIDMTADALDAGDVQENFYDEPPDRWPAPLDDRNGDPLPVLIRYVPDVKAATYRDNVDRAVGLAALKKRTGGALLWIDEIGLVAPAGQVKPYTRHLLHQGRHDKTTAVFCGPRPMTIDPMVISQSDFVYVFELPNPADRRRIADVCGIDPNEMDEAVHTLPKGGHDYLRWDGQELISFPPLPLTKARRTGRSPEPVDDRDDRNSSG